MIPDYALIEYVPWFRQKWALMHQAGHCGPVGCEDFDQILMAWLDEDAPDPGDYIAEHATKPTTTHRSA